jgi:probable F420-dependent oxidoreductase
VIHALMFIERIWMKTSVPVSTALPNCREGRLNPIGAVDRAWLIDIAQAAEELGYHSLWLNEFITTDPSVLANFDEPPSYYDALTTIAYLAARTARVRFLTSTIVLPLHEPLLLSRQVATLDVLSDGRITLGTGLGGSVEEFRRIRGDLAGANRGRLMSECLGALRRLWADRRASYTGNYIKFSDVEAFPKPVQEPLPIYMAGTADTVLERIAEFGQGWIDTVLSADQVRAKRDTLERLTSDVPGRASDSIQVARQFYVSVAGSRAEAETQLVNSLPGARKPPTAANSGNITDMTVVGDPGDIRTTVSRYVDAGVTEVCLVFYAQSAASALAQMETMANELDGAL